MIGYRVQSRSRGRRRPERHGGRFEMKTQVRPIELTLIQIIEHRRIDTTKIPPNLSRAKKAIVTLIITKERTSQEPAE